MQRLGEQNRHLAEGLRGGRSTQDRSAAPADNLDHTLPVKLATELSKMHRRLESLPMNHTGILPLRKALERLERELRTRGYTIHDYTGEPYVDGMRIRVGAFVDTPNLCPGEQRILRTIRPEIRHAGVVIEQALVEVTIRTHAAQACVSDCSSNRA